ncbi:MAG: hypothetical protein ACKOT0_07220 [bacterium]
MKFRKITGVAAAAALLVGGTVAVASSASAAPLVPASGATFLMFSPATVVGLVENDVPAWSIQPSGSTILVEGRQGAWVVEFAITALEKGKRLTHLGGVMFTHTHHSGHEAGHTEEVALYDPTVNLVKAKISAVLVYEGTDYGRKNVFAISGGRITASAIEDIKVKFLPGKAEAVNELLGVHVFAPEQRIGKADVVVS